MPDVVLALRGHATGDVLHARFGMRGRYSSSGRSMVPSNEKAAEPVM